MKIKSFFLLLILFAARIPLMAQSDEKREYEQSVDIEMVPGPILEYLSPFIDKARKVKFFRESDGENRTWEIKMKYQGRQFSIEFFDDNRLKDIEELVRWKRLNEEMRRPLNEYFDSNYKRFRIKRLQKQYHPANPSAPEEFLVKVLSSAQVPPDGYEIEAEVSGRETDDFGLFEYRFDQNFQMLSKRKIIPVSDGNLLF